MKKIISSLIAILILLIGFVWFYSPSLSHQEKYQPSVKTPLNQNFEPIDTSVPESSEYISYTNFRQEIATLNATRAFIESQIQNKVIRIDTAEELYWFSIDVSFNQQHFYISSNPSENGKLSIDVIDLLLTLDYVLGNDINYGSMGAKQFIPIGYNFISAINDTLIRNVFSGTFDGRGFEITNLYFAGYDYVTTVETPQGIRVETALSEYYAMFAYNEGEIRNLGLINSNLELLLDHQDLNKAATLVGENSGLVENVYVIDNRTSAFTAGIRMRVPPGTIAERYTAAGIVYENKGIFRQAYFSSLVTVNGSYINNFLVQPVLYRNTGAGIISHLRYDTSVYLTQLTVGSSTINITPANSLAGGYTTEELRSGYRMVEGQPVYIFGEVSPWHFYAQDRYPMLFGLEFDNVNNQYLIAEATDLIAFSKVINFNTTLNNVNFRSANYIIINDLDMSIFARGAYKTSTIEFSGSLTGDKGNGVRPYIRHLHLLNGRVFDDGYFSGMFGILTGEVSNLIVANSSISLNDTSSFYSSTFRIGFIAGLLDKGVISNVSVNTTINLGTGAIGRIYAAGIAGQASGVIDNTYATGNIITGTHQFSNEYQIIPVYYIGGIAGAANIDKLTIDNVLNTIDIEGIGNTGPVSIAGGTTVTIAIGGIIGFVQNTASIRHVFSKMVNEGDISAINFTSSNQIRQYLGGVFGLSQGQKFTLSSVFGQWENSGNINVESMGATTLVRAAGIGISNHSEKVEFLLVTNKGGFTTVSYTNFNYAGVIYDMSTTAGVTLSQATNEFDFAFTSQPTNFSPVFYSENNAQSLLRFVENKGDLTYSNFSTNAVLNIAGITTSTNVDFLNVYFSGKMAIYSLSTSHITNVAGIAPVLSSQRTMKNVLNDGEIYVAAIQAGQNIFVGGLVSTNLSGDLHTKDNTAEPKADIGIINSINYANILSTYRYLEGENTITVYGINGNGTLFGNVYAAGVAARNEGSIQDSANLGDISFAHINTAILATNTTYYTMGPGGATSTTAGLITKFSAGITLGGIAAVVTHGNSRIFDAANNGDITGISKNYVRSGGILGTVLLSEVTAGGITVDSNVSNATVADSNHISNSILSNCVNYGNIVAFTDTIGEYSPGTGSTGDRPTIYASAGGVIAYGLSTMRRMLTHGNAASTDVAGGIVGATFVMGGTGNITTVRIDTAINYGSIRAIERKDFVNVNKIDISYENVESYLYNPNDPFILPTTSSNLRTVPLHKRGIGGIFGRLQRGYNGVMTSEGGIFNFIVNTDPNVDLIGRLDQVADFTSTAPFFRFANAIYFSARPNDTTQAVFTGYYTYRNITGYNFEANQRRITTTGNIISWTSITEFRVLRGTITFSNVTKRIGNVVTNISSETVTLSQDTYITTARTTGWFSSPPGSSTTNYNPPQWFSSSQSVNLGADYIYPIPIRYISESPLENGEFMYDEDFDMRDDTKKLPPTNEPITSYIYYVERDLLAPRFQATRPHGMYVLATSAGRQVGSVLPANLDLTNVYRLKEPIPFDVNLDYEHISMNYKEEMTAEIGSVRYKYEQMIQTIYNDRSALLEEDQTFYLNEIGGSQTQLINADFNGENNTITFEISLEAFDSNQGTASYRVAAASLPVNALIAASINDYDGGSLSGNLNAFRELLYLEKDAGISENVIPTLEIDLSYYFNLGIVQPTDPISMGIFVSYSEAAVNNTIFTSVYMTEYEVFIILKPELSESGGSIDITSVVVDGVTFSANNFFNPSNPEDVKVNQTIRFNFADTAGLLTNGTDIGNLVELWYQYYDEIDQETKEIQVNGAYFTKTSQPVNGGLFSVTFNLSNQLRLGTFVMYYRYFFVGTPEFVTFDKAGSNQKAITSLSYRTFDEFGPFEGITFLTDIDFAVSLNLSNISWQTTTTTAPPYLHNTVHSVNFLTGFDISPFASIDSISHNPENNFFVDGYKHYIITYIIRAENDTTQTYTQTIREREIDVYDVFRNNNRVDINNIFARREAEQTIFALNLNINTQDAVAIYNTQLENPSSYFEISWTGRKVSIVGGQEQPGDFYESSEIKGISYFTDTRLNVIMTNETLPGYYYFTITYHRKTFDGEIETSHNIVYIQTELIIKKNLGIDAYLKDIRFSAASIETSYPNIAISDNNGTVLEGATRLPRVYFAGIDYDGADAAGFRNFRVDGTVANTPLNEYTPFFLEFLPFGATIAKRLDFDEATQEWNYSNEVRSDSVDSLKAELAADFTDEAGEFGAQNTIVTYRITSEDKKTQVYYHVTVFDIVYNVSLLFTVYYVVNDVAILAYNSALSGKPIIINVKNFETDGILGTNIASTVADFPSFTEIYSYNNNTTQFHVPHTEMIRYGFGRNISGFYSFDVQLERDQNGNELYDYYITFNGETLPNLIEVIYPDPEDRENIVGYRGKYYYIEYGERNRTRRFNIYISLKDDVETNKLWGLTDYYYSWDN